MSSGISNFFSKPYIQSKPVEKMEKEPSKGKMPAEAAAFLSACGDPDYLDKYFSNAESKSFSTIG